MSKTTPSNMTTDENTLTPDAAVLPTSVSDLQAMIDAAVAAALKNKKADEGVKAESVNDNGEAAKLKAYYEELVTVNLFYDGQKYKDDVIVNVNGKAYQIQRGKDVEVPRFVYEVLQNSANQDRATAEMIRGLEKKYEEDSKDK